MAFDAVNYIQYLQERKKAESDFEMLNKGRRNFSVASKSKSYKAYNTEWSYDERKNILKTELKKENIWTIRVDGYEPKQDGTHYVISGYMFIDGDPIDESLFKGKVRISTGMKTYDHYIDEDTGRFVFHVGDINVRWLIHSHGVMKIPKGAILEIKDFKFEEGFTETPYTPAPEDIDADPIVAEVAEATYISKSNKERLKDLENAVTELGGSD